MGLMLWPLMGTAQTIDCPSSSLHNSQAPKLSISIVPQLPPIELFKRWAPLLKAVTEQTGLCFSLSVQRNIPEFESQFLRGEPDLVFLNPYHQVMAHKAQGYAPLLADRQLLTGIVVVRKDSPISTLKDLNDQSIAFPAPNAFAASLLIRAILAEENIQFRTQYVQTHSNVYRAIAAGQVSAGGGVNNTLLREPQALQDGLRVLYETPGFRSHPLSVHPRIPRPIREAITKAFFNLSEMPQGRELLNQVQIPNPISVSHAKDYAPLERLGVQKFVVSNE